MTIIQIRLVQLAATIIGMLVLFIPGAIAGFFLVHYIFRNHPAVKAAKAKAAMDTKSYQPPHGPLCLCLICEAKWRGP